MSRYTCCCCNVQTGCLIISILGIIGSIWPPNIIGLIANICLFVAFFSKGPSLYSVYIVMSCISLIIEIILFITCVVFAIKPELWNDPAWIHDNFPALTPQQFFISLAVGTLISIILTLWFINIAKRAREYVREKYGHCHQ